MGLEGGARGQGARCAGSEGPQELPQLQDPLHWLPFFQCIHSLNFFLGHLPPPRCSSAVRNGLLLLNLLLCNHHTLGDQIITQELRDTLFRLSGIAPGTEPMPTTRTILMMLLNRYSEPLCRPEHTGTIVQWAGQPGNPTVAARGWEGYGIRSSPFLERQEANSGNGSRFWCLN